ncbi:MAG TPA: hypothetical protein VLY87_00930 [Flavobacterium sp.]|nr:hypothetical protein [Flavobacterium sp.]
MKSITPYLVRFAVAASILTIVFRYFLSTGIENNNATLVLLSSVIYGLAMFVTGWFFGQKDGNYLPISDVGFRFHLTTFLVHNIISELWFVFGLQASKETINTIHYTILFWLPFLIIHYIFYLVAKKKSIKGLNKDDLFE